MAPAHSSHHRSAPVHNAPVPPSAPAPRAPQGDSLRGLDPVPVVIPWGNPDRLLADLVEVAVWTSADGSWQEHASFLLGTSDGRWHHVPFAEPAATTLIAALCALPGFDKDLLLDLLGQRTRRVLTLWTHPQHPSRVGG